jgi:predicted N-acetyltransferase YhbS
MSGIDRAPDALHLDDGAVLRPAGADDIPALGSVIEDRTGPDDRTDLELVAATEAGLAGVALVERDGRPVATATLLEEQVRVGQVTLPAGQVELVACTRDSEHRGYVRALMDWCHRTSAARGHVLQVMIGIPTFYRQFGYEYAIPMHPWATLAPGTLGSTTLTVRTATEADLDAAQALQDDVQRHFDVAMPHQPECWQWIVRGSSTELWVVEDCEADSSPIRGVARVASDGEGAVAVDELATRDGDATQSLLSAAQRRAAPTGSVRVGGRPHVPGLAEQLGARERPEWYYVRIPSPAALLEALRPELSARLDGGGPPSGQALLSFYRSHVRFGWDEAGVGPLTTGGPLQAPVSAGGSGIPLQAVAALVLGCGAPGLEERFPDAHLGRQAELMARLFPARSADLLTWYLDA